MKFITGKFWTKSISRRSHGLETALFRSFVALGLNRREISPLRNPARQNAACKKMPGYSGRNDSAFCFAGAVTSRLAQNS